MKAVQFDPGWSGEIEQRLGPLLERRGYVRWHCGPCQTETQTLQYAYYLSWSYWMLFVRNGSRLDVWMRHTIDSAINRAESWYHVRCLSARLRKSRVLPDPLTWERVESLLRDEYKKYGSLLFDLSGRLLPHWRLNRLHRKHGLVLPDEVRMFTGIDEPKARTKHELVMKCFPYLFSRYGFEWVRTRESRKYGWREVHIALEDIHIRFDHNVRDGWSVLFGFEDRFEKGHYLDDLIRCLDNNAPTAEIPNLAEWGELLEPYVPDMLEALKPEKRDSSLEALASVKHPPEPKWLKDFFDRKDAGDAGP